METSYKRLRLHGASPRLMPTDPGLLTATARQACLACCRAGLVGRRHAYTLTLSMKRQFDDGDAICHPPRFPNCAIRALTADYIADWMEE